MQNTVNAFKHRLGDEARILSGNPCTDRLVRMECAHGYIDVVYLLEEGASVETANVVCLLEEGASVEIADDGQRMCLDPTARSLGTFQACSGYQGAVDALLACAGWGVELFIKVGTF
jgi:hypothetical protein